jgi:hypothetical protein
MSRKDIEEESGIKSNTADSNVQYYEEAEEDSRPARGNGSGLGCFILPGLQKLRRICNTAAEDADCDGIQVEVVGAVSAGSHGGMGGRGKESDDPGSVPCSTLHSPVQSEIIPQAVTTPRNVTTAVEVKTEGDAGECELFDSSDNEDLVPQRQRELKKADWDAVDTQLSEHTSAFYEQDNEHVDDDGDAQGTFLSMSSNGQIQLIATTAISIRLPLPLSSDNARACTAETAPDTVRQQSPNKIPEGTSRQSGKKWVVPCKKVSRAMEMEKDKDTEKENEVSRDGINLQCSQISCSADLVKGTTDQKSLSISSNSKSSTGCSSSSSSCSTKNPHAMHIPAVKVLHSTVIAKGVPTQPPKNTAESLLRRSTKLQVMCTYYTLMRQCDEGSSCYSDCYCFSVTMRSHSFAKTTYLAYANNYLSHD